MEKTKLDELKKEYPPEFYSVSEAGGKLVINEKKTVVWIPVRFIKSLPEGDPKALADCLDGLVKQVELDASYFEAGQKAITAKCSKALAEKARECRCTKFAYIMALLNEGMVKK